MGAADPSRAMAAPEIRIQLLPIQVFSGERDAEELRLLIERLLVVRIQGEEGVQVVHRPHERAPSEGFSETQARQEAEKIGVRWVVWGSFTQAGRLLSLDLRLLDVQGRGDPVPVFVQASDREQLLSQAEGEVDKILGKILQRKKVVEIRVEGNRRIGADAILLKTKTRVGDEYSPHRLQADIREIDKLAYFEDVQVNVEDVKDGKAVVFAVKEKPTIREILITGNDKIDADKIKESITLQPQGILNYQVLNDSVEKIKKLYQEKGFYGAEASFELKDLEGNQKGVIFRIQEGKKFWIKTINFQGNDHFPAKELKGVMKTKEKDWLHWFTDSGVLDQEALRQDVERLADFYYNNGYLKVRIGAPRVEHDQEWIHVTLGIEEGDAYTIRTIRLEGDLLEAEEVMKASLQIREKECFSRETLRKDVQGLSERYADLGYAYVEVKPATAIQDESKTVDISLRIQQKQKVQIGRIRITGNTKTRDKVIRRELQLGEGDTFNGTALKKSTERLRAVKYFEEVNVTTTPGAVEQIVDVNVEVKEQQTGTFSIGAGYSSVDQLMGIAEVQQNNLFGRGYKVRLKAEVGMKRQYYTFSFIDPWVLDTRWSGRFDAYNQERIYEDYTRSAQGGDILFTRPLEMIMPNLTGTVGYRLEDVEIKDIDANSALIFREQQGRHITSEAVGGLTFDTRDQVLYPSRGSVTNFTTEFAGLGGDNYFVKHIINSAWYFPVKWDTVFMARGEFGYAYGWGGRELPVYERFFLGGLNSIRGFKPGSVGPRDKATGDVVGGDTEVFFNFEYIFPIVKKLELRGVLFYDTGNAFLSTDKQGAFNIANFRHTVGAGIRWYSPLGPLRVEIGYNLKPQFDEKQIEWGFAAGGGF